MARAMGSDRELSAAGMLNEARPADKKPEKKPPKVMKRMEHERGSDGTHIFTHHHTHPEHHPAEMHHYKPDAAKPKAHDEAAMEHFRKHAIAPGEDEPETEAGEENQATVEE